MRIPFFLRRPWLIVRGTLTNRDRPDLDSLRQIEDPESFVWAMLPHAARTFATSIMVLPYRDAWAAAIAYLQCRILDTYEDVYPDAATRPEVLREVGARWAHGQHPITELPVELASSPRDQVHLLLVDRIELLDRAYATLSPAERESIDELVGNMAEGMAWASETLSEQGGLLHDREQRATYCHYVIGEPALYAMRSLLHVPVTDEGRRDALQVAVFIQLANITRDIEKDLQRGVGYDESLGSALGATELAAATRRDIASLRLELMKEALAEFPAYARLVAALPGGVSQARGAAALMLGFTDRYYAGCAQRAGHAGWKRRSRPLIYADGILASVSSRWAGRTVERSRRNFAGFLSSL